MAAQGKMERRLSRQSLEEPFTPDNFDALSKEKYDLIAGKRTLTMVARTALERAPRKHHNAELLQTAIVDAGKHLKAHGVTRLASMSTLPPHDQILDTLLMVGEARISEWLEYDSVQLTDVSTGAVEKMPSGRALVTNKRLLLLRTTENDDAVLHLPDRRPAWPCYLGIFGMNLCACCCDTASVDEFKVSHGISQETSYKPIPLKGVKSVELSSINAVSNTTGLLHLRPCCCGCCSCPCRASLCCTGCNCCEKTVIYPNANMSCCQNMDCRHCLDTIKPPAVESLAAKEAAIVLGLLLPPWSKQSTLTLNIASATEMDTTTSFLKALQNHSPELKGLQYDPLMLGYGVGQSGHVVTKQPSATETLALFARFKTTDV